MIQEQFEKLQELVATKLIDVDDFYVVDLDNSRISLQGHFTKEVYKKYKELANISFDEECGWFKGRKGGIRIVLTID